MRASLGPILTGSLLAALLLGCGSSGDNPDPPGAPAPQPTVLPTVNPVERDYNLEWYARISASSQKADGYAAENVADRMLSAGGGSVRWFVWAPQTPNDDFILLEWNSQVEVSKLRLFDNPQKGSQVLSGVIQFENGRTGESFDPVTFGALPDDATSPLTVAGPSKAVTAVRIRITSHRGDLAGFAEIVVAGRRVDEEIAEGNIAPFARVSEDRVPVLDPGYPGTDTGPNRTVHAIDDDLGTSWVSLGLGGNAYIELRFDRAYTMSEVALFDLKSGTRFTEGALRFPGVAGAHTFAKEKPSDESVTIRLADPVTADRIRIELTKVLDGANTGLREIQIKGSYKP